MAKRKKPKPPIDYHNPNVPPPNANVGDPNTGKLEYRKIYIGDLCILISYKTGSVCIMMVHELFKDGISITGSSIAPYTPVAIIPIENLADGRFVRMVNASELIPSYVELVGKQFCNYETFSHQISLYYKNHEFKFTRN